MQDADKMTDRRTIIELAVPPTKIFSIFLWFSITYPLGACGARPRRLRRLLPPNEMSECAPVYGKKLNKCTLNNLTNPILSQSTAVMSGICNDSYGTDSCVICCKKFVDTEGPCVTIGEKGCQLWLHAPNLATTLKWQSICRPVRMRLMCTQRRNFTKRNTRLESECSEHGADFVPEKLQSSTPSFDWRSCCFFCGKLASVVDRHRERSDIHVHVANTLELYDSIQAAEASEKWAGQTPFSPFQAFLPSPPFPFLCFPSLPHSLTPISLFPSSYAHRGAGSVIKLAKLTGSGLGQAWIQKARLGGRELG